MLITKSSGSAVAPGLEDLNARGPLKVYPKWRLEESALASRAVAPIDRHPSRQIPRALRAFLDSCRSHPAPCTRRICHAVVVTRSARSAGLR
jgi:hypothetical protein